MCNINFGAIFFVCFISGIVYLYYVNHTPEALAEHAKITAAYDECWKLHRSIREECLSKPLAQADTCGDLAWMKRNDCLDSKGVNE